MIRRILSICGIAIVTLSLACGKTEEKVVARIGDEVITVGQMKDDYLNISLGARPVLATIEEREQFARDVVSKEIMVREARKIGFDRMPEIVEMAQAEIQKQAWQAYYQDKVKSRVTITDDDLEGLYGTTIPVFYLSFITNQEFAIREE